MGSRAIRRHPADQHTMTPTVSGTRAAMADACRELACTSAAQLVGVLGRAASPVGGCSSGSSPVGELARIDTYQGHRSAEELALAVAPLATLTCAVSPLSSTRSCRQHPAQRRAQPRPCRQHPACRRTLPRQPSIAGSSHRRRLVIENGDGIAVAAAGARSRSM
jgi:hypothetical protein